MDARMAADTQWSGLARPEQDIAMQLPGYQLKLERMVPDQKLILVEAAYGDIRIWDSLAELYLFETLDHDALRTYIQKTYRADGSERPDDRGREIS